MLLVTMKVFKWHFFANRLIITIGFSIYHIGYFIEHLAGGANINSFKHNLQLSRYTKQNYLWNDNL